MATLQEPLAGKMVSLPKRANREARFNMAMERARASFDRPQQAMFVHQSRTTVPPLTRSRTTSCAHQNSAAMPVNLLSMSPRSGRK